MNRFENQVVLVTGAGGDIGAATAARFAREGAALGLLDLRAEPLSRTARQCQELGAKVVAHTVDQTERGQIDEAVHQVVDALGHIDVLFANAGYGKFATFLDQPVREWQRHVDVNLTGTFHVCQEVARHMVGRAQGGAIVVNASSGAVQYTDLLAAYCATKAALAMLVQAMASELGGHRIRVNAVLPGVIETGMTAPALEDDQHREPLVAATPLGRLGRPEDVASVVAFLASDDAAFVTGHSVAVDGGQILHGQPQWFHTDYRRMHQIEWTRGAR